MGNTPAYAVRWIPATVHPHVRGEYRSIALRVSFEDGSSPRAWGILPLQGGLSTIGRFIPTCVGNTTPFFERCDKRAVHPHVRGEYVKVTLFLTTLSGSSPRAWGIRYLPQRGKDALRFIPTCVGNTGKLPTGPPDHKVHPHVRGEYVSSAKSVLPKRGSSPRAWGIPSHNLREKGRLRFIPTCVGNTLCFSVKFITGSVHPHVRGEYCRRTGP